MRLILLLLLAFLPVSAHSRPVPEDRPALWKVADRDTTIWLFGTIHMLKPGHEWFRGPVADAFAKADALAIETRIPEQAVVQEVIRRRAIDPAGRPLAKQLPPKLYKRVVKQMKAYRMPMQYFEPFEPWYVAMSLELVAYQKLGLAADSGVEPRLLADAARTGKRIAALEGFEEQIGYFDTLPPQLQVDLLRATLDETGSANRRIDDLVSAWSRGDVARLAKAMNDSLGRMPELRAVLLDRRNARWAEWISGRMTRPGKVFVAVGAGHLGGKGNLLELLEARGYKVERIQ